MIGDLGGGGVFSDLDRIAWWSGTQVGVAGDGVSSGGFDCCCCCSAVVAMLQIRVSSHSVETPCDHIIFLDQS